MQGSEVGVANKAFLLNSVVDDNTELCGAGGERKHIGADRVDAGRKSVQYSRVRRRVGDFLRQQRPAEWRAADADAAAPVGPLCRGCRRLPTM